MAVYFCDVFDSIGEPWNLTGFVIGFLPSLQVLGFGCLVVWQMSRMHMIDLHCTDTEYSENLLESARIDGASSFQCFWKIKLHWWCLLLLLDFSLLFTNFPELYDQNLTLTGGGPWNLQKCLLWIFVIQHFQETCMEWHRQKELSSLL